MPASETVRPDGETTDVVGERIGAQVVDVVLLFVQLLVVGLGLAWLLGPATSAGVRGLVYLGALTLPLYGGLLEGLWNGQTVGKRLFGVRVVDRDGGSPSVGQALVRNVPAVIVFSWLTTAVALAAIATDDRHQRLFDRPAGTYVVEARSTGTRRTGTRRGTGSRRRVGSTGERR